MGFVKELCSYTKCVKGAKHRENAISVVEDVHVLAIHIAVLNREIQTHFELI